MRRAKFRALLHMNHPANATTDRTWSTTVVVPPVTEEFAMGKTYTVSEMRLIERVAAAMYETPDPTDRDTPVSPWPPTHREDRARWTAHATAAINAIKES